MADPNPIKVIDVFSNIFEKDFAQSSQNPPYNCKVNRENPELASIKYELYRETYYQLESESGVKIPAYQRDIGTYDEPEVEIITLQEWLALPNRPAKIGELHNEISLAKDAERKLGINHIRHYPHWIAADMMKTIEVPELKINENLVNQ